MCNVFFPIKSKTEGLTIISVCQNDCWFLSCNISLWTSSYPHVWQFWGLERTLLTLWMNRIIPGRATWWTVATSTSCECIQLSCYLSHIFLNWSQLCSFPGEYTWWLGMVWCWGTCSGFLWSWHCFLVVRKTWLASYPRILLRIDIKNFPWPVCSSQNLSFLVFHNQKLFPSLLAPLHFMPSPPR